MNLYKLEWIKIRRSTYLWGILGIFASLLALGIFFLFLFQTETGAVPEEDLFADWDGLLALTTALSFACFSVFSAIIAAKIIIHEYCGKNAVILLSYPIRRKKILQTKCRMTCAMTAISAFLANVLVIGILYVIAKILQMARPIDTEHFVFTVLGSGALMGILSSALGIISAAVGWKKRSATATIVCSLLIVCAVTNVIAVSPNHILLVLLGMVVVFVIIAGGMYQILANGIEKMEV